MTRTCGSLAGIVSLGAFSISALSGIQTAEAQQPAGSAVPANTAPPDGTAVLGGATPPSASSAPAARATPPGPPAGPPAGAFSSAAQGPYPPPPYGYGYPPPPRGLEAWADEIAPKRRWYGWKLLIIHGISTLTLVLSPVDGGAIAPVTVPLGIGGLLFGSPAVHWAHGHFARGFWSLGLHFGSILAAAGTGGLIVCSFGGCKGSYGSLGFLAGAAIGAPVGSVTALIIDSAVLSYDDPEPPMPYGSRGLDPRPRASKLTILPTLDLQPNRAILGAAGTF